MAEPLYDERLRIPWSWWPALLLVVGMGTFEVAAGFTYLVFVPVAVFLVGFLVMPLLIMGMTRVRVVDGRLRAGDASIGVTELTAIQPLAREQFRARLGPQADPAARTVVRGWVGTGVMIRLQNPHPVPYWLVSTRHPQQLADALKLARQQERDGGGAGRGRAQRSARS